MGKIPDDIMKAASDITQDPICWPVPIADSLLLKQLIALAILSERQACEKIARDRAEVLGNEYELSSPPDMSIFHQLKEAVNLAHLIAARSP
jgi:hypothetical protein